MKKILAAAFCLSLLMSQHTIAGDAEPAAKAEPPVKGELQSSVEKIFGMPKEKKPAVGNPPISRWVYDDFTVYFENDRVIHSVKNTKE